MKRLSLILAASLALTGAAFADAPILTCPAPSDIHPIPDSSTPNQYDYATVNIAGLGFYVSMTTKSSPVAVSSFVSVDNIHNNMITSVTPTHCYYRLADGTIMGLHSVNSIGPMEQITPATNQDWQNRGFYDHCEGTNVNDCSWSLKIVPPSSSNS